MTSLDAMRMPLTTRVTTTTSLLAALIVPACSPTAGVVGDGSFGVPETDTCAARFFVNFFSV